MANTEGLGSALVRGYQVGRDTGGRLSGVGQAISKIADRLRAERETQEQLNLLGKTEKIKAQYDPQAQMINAVFGNGERIAPTSPNVGTLAQDTSAVTSDKLRRGLIAKITGVPYEQMMTEEEKQAEIKQAAEKTIAIEGVKPYTEGEIKIVSGLSLIPQIDKLINLAETKNVYGEGKFGKAFVPFGASRISAFGEPGPWQSFKRGLTAGAGREAGLILQDIKQVMFATGGQALTNPEILKLAPKLQPAYKTEEQWIADLKDVKQRIIEKARLMRPNPNVALPNNQNISKKDMQYTEEDMQYTMEKYGLSRQEVLKRLGL